VFVGESNQRTCTQKFRVVGMRENRQHSYRHSHPLYQDLPVVLRPSMPPNVPPTAIGKLAFLASATLSFAFTLWSRRLSKQ
jgi:hypothetical protein